MAGNCHEWERQMIKQISSWLEATPVSVTLQQVSWAIPAIQTIHILAIAALFSSVCLISARLAGLNQSASLDEIIRVNLRIFWPATAVLFMSGALLVVSEPGRDLMNPMFWAKMALLLAGLLFIGVMKSASRRFGTSGDQHPLSVKAMISVSVAQLAIWMSVITCGRWIAYFDAGAN